MLKYRIVVEGLLKDGHPTQFLEATWDGAWALGEKLHIIYPDRTVISYETVERKNMEWAPECCTKGHSGKVDGRNVIQNGMCTICGETNK